MRPKYPHLLTAFAIVLASFSVLLSQEPTVTGKIPIIIVPGLTGSELVNSRTGETVWYKTSRSKDDDVRLPMSANIARDRDSLIAGDIIRGVKIAKFLPEVEIYERLISSLQEVGGYHEAKWATATKADREDSFFVFAYDWRRDNVENARLFIKKVEALKKRLGKADLKFNVIAHSMGGLISCYAAMYGDSELPNGKPRPNWAGAKHFNKIFLIGTPNEGSVSALNGLLNGVSYVAGGINLPWIQNLSRFDVFTIPSVFQLLPYDGTFVAYDEDLQPIKLDVYDPNTWDEYDWSIWRDKDFKKKFSPSEQAMARPYFFAALARAKRFQAALDANTSPKTPVRFYLMGAECKDTLNAVVLRRSEKKDSWITLFEANSFTNSSGRKISSEELKPLIYAAGDGVVPKRSLAADTLAGNGEPNVLPISGEIYQCEGHSKLVTNPEIQKKLFQLVGALSAE